MGGEQSKEKTIASVAIEEPRHKRHREWRSMYPGPLRSEVRLIRLKAERTEMPPKSARHVRLRSTQVSRRLGTWNRDKLFLMFCSSLHDYGHINTMSIMEHPALPLHSPHHGLLSSPFLPHKHQHQRHGVPGIFFYNYNRTR
jgi:hypothetical protein